MSSPRRASGFFSEGSSAGFILCMISDMMGAAKSQDIRADAIHPCAQQIQYREGAVSVSLKSLFRFLLPAFVFCLLLGAASAEKTVVMLYLCGSNLESQYGLASRDLQEILDSGYDRDETEVLVLSGGSRVWHYGMDTERTSLYRVSP